MNSVSQSPENENSEGKNHSRSFVSSKLKTQNWTRPASVDHRDALDDGLLGGGDGAVVVDGPGILGDLLDDGQTLLVGHPAEGGVLTVQELLIRHADE